MATAKSKTRANASRATKAVPEAKAVAAVPAKKNLVICAYPGTGEQLALVWSKMTGAELTTITVDERTSLRDTVARVVAMPEVADDFVLVPANCVPCSPLSLEELKGPFVFVDIYGKRHFADRLPVYLEKTLLVDDLAASEATDDETFMRDYHKRHLHRPIEGGFRFGNLVTPVYRGNPCENLVIEAFVRKKFVTASPIGYKAISNLVEQYLLR
jgi:hypothetical protein